MNLKILLFSCTILIAVSSCCAAVYPIARVESYQKKQIAQETNTLVENYNRLEINQALESYRATERLCLRATDKRFFREQQFLLTEALSGNFIQEQLEQPWQEITPDSSEKNAPQDSAATRCIIS